MEVLRKGYRGWGLVVAIVAVMAVAACDDDVDKGGNGMMADPLVVTFHIGTPESEEVEYTRATQDASETRINRLTVYDFLVKESTKAGKADTLFESVQYLTDAGDGMATPKAGQFIRTDAGATACLSLHTEEGTQHVFAFIANEEKTHFDSILYQKILPIDSLRRTLSVRRLKSGESCGSLVGEKGPVMTGTSVPISVPADLKDTEKMRVKLYRTMARVDVEHEVANGQNLRIVDVSAKNCAPTGYLFGAGSDGKANVETVSKNFSPISIVRNPAVGTEDLESLKQGQTCGKVLYLYEYPTTEKSVPTLILTYTLNGSPRTMEVPMTSGGTRIEIKRNRKYTLVIGGTDTRMTYSIRE